MSKLLADEIKWINENLDRYEGAMHAKAVIGNIEKRYKIADLEKKLEGVESMLHLSGLNLELTNDLLRRQQTVAIWARIKWIFTGAPQ